MRSLGIFIGIAIFSAAVFIIQFFGGFYPHYSDGFRAGIVQKASRKGIFCKSVAGELVLQGIGSEATSRQGPGFRDVWEFSAADPAIMDKLREAAAVQRPVRLTYRQWLVKPWCLTNDYEVIEVQ